MLLAGASPSEQHTVRARAAQPSRSDLQQQHASSSRVDSLERARQHVVYPNLEAPAFTRAARAAEATSSGHWGCVADAAASEAPELHSASRHDFEQHTQPSSPVLDPASCDGAWAGAALPAGVPVQMRGGAHMRSHLLQQGNLCAEHSARAADPHLNAPGALPRTTSSSARYGVRFPTELAHILCCSAGMEGFHCSRLHDCAVSCSAVALHAQARGSRKASRRVVTAPYRLHCRPSGRQHRHQQRLQQPALRHVYTQRSKTTQGLSHRASLAADARGTSASPRRADRATAALCGVRTGGNALCGDSRAAHALVEKFRRCAHWLLAPGSAPAGASALAFTTVSTLSTVELEAGSAASGVRGYQRNTQAHLLKSLHLHLRLQALRIHPSAEQASD